MSRQDLIDAIEEATKTDFTKVHHQEPYPAISTSRPELSQAGKAVLITGGGTGVGFSIAKAFIEANASVMIILGRRPQILDAARLELEAFATKQKKDTKVITFSCDVGDVREVDSAWKKLADEGIDVDVFVANAVKFTDFKPLLELGVDEVWSQMETNVKSPLYLAEKFMKQGNGKQKYILHISTASVHGLDMPVIQAQPAYTLTKMTATLLFQLLASDNPHDKVQVINFHPGVVMNDIWRSANIGREDGLQSTELTGAFAVWAASKEAAFLHGRYVWCSWDVEEMATGEIRKRIDEDPYYLRPSIIGLRRGFKA